jgi:hypothetical protein
VAVHVDEHPRELPGFTAASVGLALRTEVALLPCSPQTTSAVERGDDAGGDGAREPSGEPMAPTCWPTLSDADEPSGAGTRLSTPSTLMTARSASGSQPRIVADAVRPSWNDIVSETPSAASAITWLFVRMTPTKQVPMPEPVPLDVATVGRSSCPAVTAAPMAPPTPPASWAVARTAAVVGPSPPRGTGARVTGAVATDACSGSDACGERRVNSGVRSSLSMTVF